MKTSSEPSYDSIIKENKRLNKHIKFLNERLKYLEEELDKVNHLNYIHKKNKLPY